MQVHAAQAGAAAPHGLPGGAQPRAAGPPHLLLHRGRARRPGAGAHKRRRATTMPPPPPLPPLPPLRPQPSRPAASAPWQRVLGGANGCAWSFGVCGRRCCLRRRASTWPCSWGCWSTARSEPLQPPPPPAGHRPSAMRCTVPARLPSLTPPCSGCRHPRNEMVWPQRFCEQPPLPPALQMGPGGSRARRWLAGGQGLAVEGPWRTRRART
jgi:hypothetical protein